MGSRPSVLLEKQPPLAHNDALSMGLGALDVFIIVAYLAGITAFGMRFRKSQRSLRDYFLAGRAVPWWAIMLSIVATETSTLTIISVPGLAYDTDLRFLQVVLGYVAGRVVVSLVLIPQYMKGEMFTAYELMERRFGRRLRSLTAGLFLLTRAAADGVRVFAVAIVVGIALGPLLGGIGALERDLISIGVITALTLLYTFEGGVAAVIWTDVLQLVIYIGGTLVGLFTILQLLPGGWEGVAAVAAPAGKFRLFDFTLDATTTYTFWAGLIGGGFLTMASHGTDQLIVQRLLVARDQRQSQAALIGSGLLVLAQFVLFLMVGVALYGFYQAFPPAVPFERSDRIFPLFIVEHMPAGIAGLLVAAILAAAMSTISSSLNSLSSTSMVDFYLRRRQQVSESEKLRLSRMATVFWALVMFGLAILARGGGRVLEVGLSIASVAYGSLLGVFLLGVLTRRANEPGTMVGMACGFFLVVALWLGSSLAWTWYVVVGTATTFAVGYIASLLFARGRETA